MKPNSAWRASQSGDSSERSFMQTRSFKALLTFCAVLVVLAVCIEVGRRLINYGSQKVAAHPVPVRFALANAPSWLGPEIYNLKLRQEAYDFARRDPATYDRCRNVADGDVLREIADLYTGSEVKDGKTISRQSVGYNAWIKRITAVKREVAKDQSEQTIEIFAEWRQAAAWVRAGDLYYLIDPDGVRLPGDYHANDRPKNLCMVISGVDVPMINGVAQPPLPGETWAAGKDGAIADDLREGLKMIATLDTQMFVSQIEAVDMTNFNGRHDPLAAWILLDTVWHSGNGAPHVIMWGRPPGMEAMREWSAASKLDVLKSIYRDYKRIDAGGDMVDVRTETSVVHKPATLGGSTPIYTAQS